MLKDNLPVYDLTFDENEDVLGCFKVSLVEEPATDELFLKFSEDKENKPKTLYFKDESKHIISGIAMLADAPIYRNQDNQEFYVKFSKDTIEQMVIKFMREQRQFDISLDHSSDVQNCYLFESYLIDKERGICPKEFSDVPDGSWFISVKIDNEDVWNKIVTDEVKGFSIETQMVTNAFKKQEKVAKEMGITMEELSKLFSVFE